MEIKVVPQKIEILHIDPNASKVIELAARTCYKSEGRICEGSDAKIINLLVSNDHTAMIEHSCATFRITTDRAIANELVRHRIASYAQESTRYVKYSEALEIVLPLGMSEDALEIVKDSAYDSYVNYCKLLKAGYKPEQARDVLPLCTKTEVVITANLREFYKNIFPLRCSEFAHPKIRLVTSYLAQIMKDEIPTVFGKTTYFTDNKELIDSSPQVEIVDLRIK